jgi:TRAP-type transport system small permease protein
MKQSIDRLCGALSGLALFGIMVLTFVDVSGRKALSQSVPGSLELTELLMVLVIFAALPLVSMQREHVVFDSLDPWLPKSVQRWQRRFMDLVCAVGLLGVAYLMAQKGLQLHASGDTSSLLKIPHAPFVWLMSALAVVTALVHLRWMAAPALEDDPASVKG